MTTLNPAEIQRVADLIANADSLVIAAGAGMGVDSGLPDFRGKEGFWQAYPALGKAGIDFAQVASPHAFRTHPRRAWGFYGHRLALYRNTQPHAGFKTLMGWGQAMPLGYRVFTSNVDGHFQKAGFPEQAVHECHGSIEFMQCLRPCTEDIWPADGFTPEIDTEQCLLLSELPLCPHCGDLARPNILMFGDGEWVDRRESRQALATERWLERVSKPVVIELGAGTAIPSVRMFSQRVVYEFDGRMVRINVRESSVPTSLDVGIAAGALEVTRAITRMLNSQA